MAAPRGATLARSVEKEGSKWKSTHRSHAQLCLWWSTEEAHKRLESFRTWPYGHLWPPQDMAKAGFYYLQEGDKPTIKNKGARNSAVERIAKNMNIPDFCASDALKKINTMRMTYKQAADKVKATNTTGIATEDVYVPNAVWYEIANRFLRGVMSIRNSKFTNLVQVDSSQNTEGEIRKRKLIQIIKWTDRQNVRFMELYEAEGVLWNVRHTEWEDEINQNQKESKTEDDTINSHSVDSDVISLNAESSCPITVTESSGEPIHDSGNNITPHTAITNVGPPKPGCSGFKTPKSSFVRNDVQRREVADEFSHFAQNIACQLRQIPLADALECQFEIMRNIQQKLLNIMCRNQPYHVPSSPLEDAYNQRFDNIHTSMSPSPSNTPSTSPLVTHLKPGPEYNEVLHITHHLLTENSADENSLLNVAIRSIGGLEHDQTV
uniref:Uncharacterized protein n=1 Tax=Timema poppense TaxID=170557 RepID=A0A7R9GZR7_TIMPO|nr:unnamed protein product [Timema poppensis]